MTHKVTHETVLLSDLDTTASFQREVVKRHPIRKDGYNEHLENEITVVEIDGKLYVDDGKQRVTIKLDLIASGALDEFTPDRPNWPFNAIRAVIFWGQTWESAATLFEKVNKNRKNLTSYNKFNAACTAGDSAATNVKIIATAKGYPPRASGKVDCLTAVSVAQDVVRIYGADVFSRVMDIHNALYPGLKPWGRLLEALPVVLTTKDPKCRKLLDDYGDKYLIEKLTRRCGSRHTNLQAYIMTSSGDNATDSTVTYVNGIKRILLSK